MSKLLVIYHGACRDGFAAAWCIWRRFAGSEFVPANYGEPPPDVAGRGVVLVDFSYPLPVMQDIAASCESLLVLDHHKTAEAALEAFAHPNAEVHFDMERSGAGLAWDHFFPETPRPWIVNYVEDRDLWRHALPDGPAVNAYLGTLRYDFEHWYQTSQLPVESVVALGQCVEDKIRHYVTEVAKNARRVVFEGHEVPMVNAPQVDISELVGFLCNGEKFAMGWWQRADGSFSYSLRSHGDFDVSELAKRYGGGGHKNAAGFQSDKLLPDPTVGAPPVHAVAPTGTQLGCTCPFPRSRCPDCGNFCSACNGAMVDDAYGAPPVHAVAPLAACGHTAYRNGIDCIQDGCPNAAYQVAAPAAHVPDAPATEWSRCGVCRSHHPGKPCEGDCPCNDAGIPGPLDDPEPAATPDAVPGEVPIPACCVSNATYATAQLLGYDCPAHGWTNPGKGEPKS